MIGYKHNFLYILLFLILVVGIGMFAYAYYHIGKEEIVDAPTPERYRPVEELIAAGRPVEAYQLLDKLEPDLFSVPQEHRYHAYALWVQAMDEADESLIPCEMLLAEALAIHQQDDYLRGKILYYQARLLDEKRYLPYVVEYYQRAVRILKNYPDETQRIYTCYNRMGQYYLFLYNPENAKVAFQKAYAVDTAARQRIKVLKHLSDLYRYSGDKDSSMICLNEGLRYAESLHDTTQIAVLNNLNVYTHNYFLELGDSISLQHPSKDFKFVYTKDNDCYYYENRGWQFYIKGEQYDSAYHYYRLALKHADKRTDIRLSANKKLAATLKQMGRHEEGMRYLEQYIALSDSLRVMAYSKSNVNRMNHRMIGDMVVDKERVRHEKQRNLLLAGAALFIVSLLSFYQWISHRKQMLMLRQEASISDMRYRQLALQKQIEEQQESIQQLQQDHSKEIGQKESLLIQLKEEQEQLTLQLFKQTNEYKLVTSIQNHNQKHPDDLKVLTVTQQDELLESIMHIFDAPISNLRAIYPELTNQDFLFYYLERLGYDTGTIAACFGKTSKNSIHQRRHRIKERMKR